MNTESAAEGAAARRAEPYLYCDYWASVLGLRGIVREAAERKGLLDAAVFRACLDRPELRLPGPSYYLLTLLAGPIFIPYRLLRIARAKILPPRADEVAAARLLEPHQLEVTPESGGRVAAAWHGEPLARGLLDPQRTEAVFSLVYPTYKVLVGAFLAILFSILSHLLLQRETVPEALADALRFAHYPLVVAIQWLIFRDVITAVAAPLPVYLVVGGMRLVGVSDPRPQAFAGALLVLAVAYFLIDAFLVPRGLPPALYLYVNDPDSPAYPYERGQGPAWLAGHAYWVWRFMSLTHAEVNKFWERDWERIEVWVRADGDAAGEIEWVVLDFHYRELWMPRERLISARHAREQAERLARLRADPERRAAWMVEVDMNALFHSPEIRGLYLMPLEAGWRRARLRQLAASLRVEVEPDRPRAFRDAVRRMRLAGLDVVADIPEHFRHYALRQLLSTPWRYWRYARGANSAARPHVYSRSDPSSPPPLASEPALQIKATAWSDPPLRRRG